MENFTNHAVDYLRYNSLRGPGFGVFLILVLLVVLTAIVLNVTIITALCVARSVSKLIRIFLINLLVAGVILALIGIGFILSGLIRNFTPPPDFEFCRSFGYDVGAPLFPDNLTYPGCGFCTFLVWGYVVLSVARHYCLAGFSIVVLLIVRYDKKEMKTLCIVLFLTVIWCVAILLNVHYLVPSLFSVQYYDGVACFVSYASSTETFYAFHAIFVIIGGLTPMTISIVVPIVVLCCVRCNTMTGSSYNKGMAKFALFLVAGNLVNLVGQAVVSLIVFVSDASNSTVYLTYTFVWISLIPTPIMILIFLKPVRIQVTKVMYCTRIHSIRPILKTSTAVN